MPAPSTCVHKCTQHYSTTARRGVPPPACLGRDGPTAQKKPGVVSSSSPELMTCRNTSSGTEVSQFPVARATP